MGQTYVTRRVCYIACGYIAILVRKPFFLSFFFTDIVPFASSHVFRRLECIFSPRAVFRVTARCNLCSIKEDKNILPGWTEIPCFFPSLLRLHTIRRFIELIRNRERFLRNTHVYISLRRKYPGKNKNYLFVISCYVREMYFHRLKLIMQNLAATGMKCLCWIYDLTLIF